jgi:hypothetical protein
MTREKTKLECAAPQDERREREENTRAAMAQQATRQSSKLTRSLLELLLRQTLDVKGMKTMELHHSERG